MTVRTQPDDTSATTLAGSDGSTAALGNSGSDLRRLAPQRTNDLEDGTAQPQPLRSDARMPSRDRLSWVCDRCDRRIAGTGAGFGVIDLRETDAAAKGQLRGPDGPVKARWHVFHAACAPECVKPLNPYFRLWTHRVQSVDDLLDAVAELSRLPWFGFSDWGLSLVRRVLADTGKTSDESVALRKQRVARKRRKSVAPDLQCSAVTTAGHKCTQAAGDDGLCGFHSGRRKVGHNNRTAEEPSS